MQIYRLSILVLDKQGWIKAWEQPLFYYKSQALKVQDRYLEKYGSDLIQTRIEALTVYENANDYRQI